MKNKGASEVFFKTVRMFIIEFMPHQRNLSDHSIQACKDSLNLLFDYIIGKREIPIKNITFDIFDDLEIIIGFLNWLESERHCCNSTINQRLSCIRSFFKYAAYKEVSLVATYNRMLTIPQRKVTESRTIEFMTEKALQTLLACPDTKTKIGLRDCFYMTLLYDAAARNCELLSLKIRNVNDSPKTPSITVDGKGNKKRCIPLMPKTMEIYRAYMREFHGNNYSPYDYLIYVRRNEQKLPMSDDNVAKFIKKHATRARELCDEMPPNIHPHMFRRTRAMHLYRSGMPLPLLSEFLGHEDPETTLIYAFADTEMKRKAIEKATANNSTMHDIMVEPIWKEDNDMIRKLYGLK